MSCWLLAEAFIDISSRLSLCISSFSRWFLLFYPFRHLLLLFSFLSFYFKETDCPYTCFLLGALSLHTALPALFLPPQSPTAAAAGSHASRGPITPFPWSQWNLTTLWACLSRFVLAIKVVLSHFLFLPLLSVPKGTLSLHDVTQDIKGSRPACMLWSMGIFWNGWTIGLIFYSLLECPSILWTRLYGYI